MGSKLVIEMPANDLHDRWRTHIAKIADAWMWVMQGRVRFRSTFRMLQRSRASEMARRDTQAWLYYLWGNEAMMAVRRELDDQAGVINLKHLLREIEARPDVMTRRRFMEWACPSGCWCHNPEEKKTATRHFESFDLVRFPQENEWDEFERDYVDPACVARDRRQMEDDAEETFRYAQLLIAHRTPKDHLEIHGDAIDRALDSIWDKVRKYYLLLASEPLTKRPRPPRHWRETFRHAWCPGNHKPEVHECQTDTHRALTKGDASTMELLVGFELGAMERNREAENIWTDFAGSVRVPFSYDSFRGCAYAAAAKGVASATLVRPGHADYRDTEYVRIVLGARFSDANANERFLTLLHESVHLARNTGPLRAVDDTKLELCEQYDYNVDPAQLAFGLAEQILEADAEFHLRANYPEHAAARARYYADLQRRRVAERPWNHLQDQNKPYAMLGHLLRLDLAIALLDNDKEAHLEIETLRKELSDEYAALDMDSGIRVALERVREILSPRRSDFEKVADWGPAAYRDVVTQILQPQPVPSSAEAASGDAAPPAIPKSSSDRLPSL